MLASLALPHKLSEHSTPLSKCVKGSQAAMAPRAGLGGLEARNTHHRCQRGRAGSWAVLATPSHGVFFPETDCDNPGGVAEMQIWRWEMGNANRRVRACVAFVQRRRGSDAGGGSVVRQLGTETLSIGRSSSGRSLSSHILRALSTTLGDHLYMIALVFLPHEASPPFMRHWVHHTCALIRLPIRWSTGGRARPSSRVAQTISDPTAVCRCGPVME